MRKFLSALMLLAMIGCTPVAVEPEMAEVSGKALYLERIAAPPNARLEVVLEDISRADAPAVRLGEMMLENAGQPPYPFTIEYDPAELDPRHSYRVAARLYDGDELLFVTDEVHQVITRGYPSTVTLRMRRVEKPLAHPLGTLPATFSGTLPYSPDMHVHLNLLADGAYFLRETRHEESYFDIGRYRLSSDGQHLALYGGREAPMRYAISTPDTLSMVDHFGLQKPDYSLSRQPTMQMLEPRVRMRGEYRYLAGAGRFRECLTGLDMPVAPEGDNRALEAAYLAEQEAPGEVVLVHVEGRIEQRMPMEGPGPVSTLVPERFGGVSAYGCPERARQADLENTYWRLTVMDASFVDPAPDQREPHLVFREDGRVAGSDGCNRVVGSYEADDTSIEFSRLAVTRMACLEGMAQAEQFRQALGEVDRYRILGQQLEMLGPGEQVRLQFRAVALE